MILPANTAEWLTEQYAFNAERDADNVRLIDDLSDAEYHGGPGISSSQVRPKPTMAHTYAASFDPERNRDESRHLTFGRARTVWYWKVMPSTASVFA